MQDTTEEDKKIRFEISGSEVLWKALEQFPVLSRKLFAAEYHNWNWKNKGEIVGAKVGSYCVFSLSGFPLTKWRNPNVHRFGILVGYIDGAKTERRMVLSAGESDIPIAVI